MPAKLNHKPDSSLKFTIKDSMVIMNASIPKKWLVFAIFTIIAWQAPEFWKIIQLVLSILKP